MMPGWLLHGDLPPVGNRIYLPADADIPPQFSGYSTCWVQSGTAALALALIMARTRRPEIEAPTVLLPAYGCPDLVAAAEFAGVRPRLVDIGADDPGYQLDQLEQSLDDTTVAVVAVNFLGIRERLAQIRELLRKHPDVLLIEDDAQWFPEPLQQPELEGDLVCLSFGRGKPVSLLGGGLLLVRDALAPMIPWSQIGSAAKAGSDLKLKLLIHNILLSRHCYWLANRNPLIELGVTKYKPLQEVRAMDSRRYAALAHAIAAYTLSSRETEQHWLRAVDSIGGVLVPASDRRRRLLRLPLICRSHEQRDALRRELDAAGLGVSAMYQRPLLRIDGVGEKVIEPVCMDGAGAFATRLLTLPLHRQVRGKDIERACRIIDSYQSMV